MSDLFDLPFEEDDEERVESQESRVESQQSVENSSSDAGLPTTDYRLPTSSRRAVFTVTELTVRVRDLLETEFVEVWVEGELSNCRFWNTGHLYFTLKDSTAQIRGVIFRSALRYLKFKPADGLRIVARGRLSVYEPKGEYQLVCEHMEPQGLGALQLAFDQLKKRLHDEGLFDATRKRPLPALPRTIGIVTSLDGAAIRDIIKVLARVGDGSRYGSTRRVPGLHLVVRPARVQGDGASVEIARGIRAIARVKGVDVVIVGRGGGSIEDLWAFNEEIVARAIAGCPVPVIAAVGHETDVTIADFVADVRAPTPTAAAELVAARCDEFCARIDRLRDRLRAAARGGVQGLSRRVHILTGRPALGGVPGRVALRGRHVAELTHALATVARASLTLRARRLGQLRRQLETFDLGRRLATIRTRLVSGEGRLDAAMTARRHRAQSQLRDHASRLETLSPLAVLGRGYAVCWNEDRTRVLRDAADVASGDAVRVTLARGELDCEVRKPRK